MRTQQLDTGLRVVAGVLGGAAGPWSGPGWTATRTAVGAYALRFTPPFKTPPVMTGAPTGGAAGVVFSTGPIATDSVTCYLLVATTGAAIDFQTTFHAEGR